MEGEKDTKRSGKYKQQDMLQGRERTDESDLRKICKLSTTEADARKSRNICSNTAGKRKHHCTENKRTSGKDAGCDAKTVQVVGQQETEGGIQGERERRSESGRVRWCSLTVLQNLK